MITALHLSSKQLQNGEAFQNNGGARPRLQEQKVARDSQPVLPVALDDGGLLEQQQKDSLGFRLQREMAWAADDSVLPADSVQQLQQQQQQQQQQRPNNKTSVGKSNIYANPPNSNTEKRSRNKTDYQNVVSLPTKELKTMKIGTISADKYFAKTEITDIFIGVKTTGSFHKNRVQLILDTWLSLAQEQVGVFFSLFLGEENFDIQN